MADTKERPILFSAPMVRAILDGRKTVTRRAAKPVKHPDLGNIYAPGALVLEKEPQHVIDRACPYGQPGDRLWVREAFLPDPDADHPAWDDWTDTYVSWSGSGSRIAGVPPALRKPKHCIYREGWNGGDLVWRPSIYMPRWASRILLEITAVRVERLQDISEEQALAEGVSPLPSGRFHCGHDEEGQITSKSPVTAFAWLWNSINGEGSWAENPWVWVVEFKVLEVARG